MSGSRAHDDVRDRQDLACPDYVSHSLLEYVPYMFRLRAK